MSLPVYQPDAMLLGKQTFAIDAEGGKLQTVSSCPQQTTEKVIAYFQRSLEEIRSGKVVLSAQDRDKFIQGADVYLKSLVAQNREKLDQGLSKCRSDRFLMSIAKLDRSLVASKFPRLQSATPLTADRVKALYATQVSRDFLDKWVAESTHTGHKRNLHEPEHRIVSGERAVEGFMLHPDEVDFLTSSFLHKQIGRLDEHIEVDPVTKHHKIRFRGEMTPVAEIAENLRIDEKGKLFSVEGDKRYFYCQDGGLKEYDPESWTELPVFRARKNARREMDAATGEVVPAADDYKLVIKTIINEETDDKHSWIELKSPTAVYNVGYFWDDRDSLPMIERCTTLRGKLHALDKNELLGREQYIRKTVCDITPEQFALLKAETEAFQNSPKAKVFNLINKSCSSWTREILAKVGIQLSSRENGTAFFFGKRIEYCYEAGTIFGKIERAWHGFLAVLRNLLIYVLGGTKSVIAKEDLAPGDLPLQSFFDIFDTSKGFFDSPKRIREWQDAVAADRARKVEELRAREGFAELSSEEQEESIRRVGQALPVDVTLPEPVATF